MSINHYKYKKLNLFEYHRDRPKNISLCIQAEAGDEMGEGEGVCSKMQCITDIPVTPTYLYRSLTES